MWYLLLFQCTNAPQCYVLRTLPVLLHFRGMLVGKFTCWQTRTLHFTECNGNSYYVHKSRENAFEKTTIGSCSKILNSCLSILPSFEFREFQSLFRMSFPIWLFCIFLSAGVCSHVLLILSQIYFWKVLFLSFPLELSNWLVYSNNSAFFFNFFKYKFSCAFQLLCQKRDSLDHDPSWEVSNSSASQTISCMLLKLYVH